MALPKFICLPAAFSTWRFHNGLRTSRRDPFRLSLIESAPKMSVPEPRIVEALK